MIFHCSGAQLFHPMSWIGSARFIHGTDPVTGDNGAYGVGEAEARFGCEGRRGQGQGLGPILLCPGNMTSKADLPFSEKKSIHAIAYPLFL